MQSGYRKAVLGLGSNLGDRVAFVRAALSSLQALPGVRGVVQSALYETLPVGGPPQGDYINCAALLITNLAPIDVLTAALAIENAFGRVRRERNGPRTLDIDVLWIDRVQVDDPDLTVPHPRLTERAFALVPMLELVPDAIDPRSGRPMQHWLDGLDLSGIRRFDDASARVVRPVERAANWS